MVVLASFVLHLAIAVKPHILAGDPGLLGRLQRHRSMSVSASGYMYVGVCVCLLLAQQVPSPVVSACVGPPRTRP